MNSQNTGDYPDSRRIGGLIALVSRLTQEPLWTLPPPELETPSIEDFVHFDAAMISAVSQRALHPLLHDWLVLNFSLQLTNMRVAGYRAITPQPGLITPSTYSTPAK